jgi:hypothetical protein
VVSSSCTATDRTFPGLLPLFTLASGDPPQQVELLVRQRAAGRVIPEFEVPAAHFTDAVRELQPDISGERIGLEGSRVDVEDRGPLPREPRVLPPRACPLTVALA